jgi:hypothetical protein
LFQFTMLGYQPGTVSSIAYRLMVRQGARQCV